MTRHIAHLIVIAGLTLLSSMTANAQHIVVSAEQVQDWMSGDRKAAVIDVRMPEEYRAGHIPGAINIPAERIAAERNKLPRAKTAPIIFYCRGVG